MFLVFLQKKNSPLGQYIKHIGNDEIRLLVEVENDGFLIVTNSYSPYWNAEIDSTTLPIYPAYGTFWGVMIPRGAHQLLFKYLEPGFNMFEKP